LNILIKITPSKMGRSIEDEGEGGGGKREVVFFKRILRFEELSYEVPQNSSRNNVFYHR
jgi:hypothetical protein